MNLLVLGTLVYVIVFATALALSYVSPSDLGVRKVAVRGLLLTPVWPVVLLVLLAWVFGCLLLD